ncbi:MAG TPA: hypothetical protein VJ672_08120 [Gemmatimonadaceae bacterium]|nr:hypothetical protein [Gemmatimonadaceae bacterium]
MPRRARARKRKTRRRAPLGRKHAVHANLNVPELTKAGSSLALSIYARGEKIGEIELGRGGVYWRGGKRHRVKRFSWSRFAEIMDDVVYED